MFKDTANELSPHKTRYLVVTGPGTAFDDAETGPNFEAFKDGTSRTIFLVEADRGVEWTKPDDLQFNAINPTLGLGAFRGYVFLCAAADGAIRSIPTHTDPRVITAMMTRAGGEQFTWP